jgi:hypothetical protein
MEFQTRYASTPTFKCVPVLYSNASMHSCHGILGVVGWNQAQRAESRVQYIVILFSRQKNGHANIQGA